MVGHSHSSHAVGNGFIYKLADFRLTVKDGILGVDVKMYKIGRHIFKLKVKREVSYSLISVCPSGVRPSADI